MFKEILILQATEQNCSLPRDITITGRVYFGVTEKGDSDPGSKIKSRRRENLKTKSLRFQ